MSVFGAVVEFERGVLERDEALKSVWERFAVSGEARLGVLRERVGFPSWPGVTSASALKAASVEAEVFAVLAEYAREARGLVRAGDAQRWAGLVGEAQRRSGEGFLGELQESTVGAALLRERWGWVPRSRSQRGGIPCQCGFATEGVLPRALCDDCQETLLRRWVAEERRILRGMPEYAEEVTAVIDRTARKQERVYVTGGEYTASEATGVRRAGGRAVARLHRRHREELPGVEMSRWEKLGAPLAAASMLAYRETASKVLRRGLGGAALTELVGLSLQVRAQHSRPATGRKSRR
ncbi:hypothetical protein [Microbacterium sp. USHLN272]|uniref:hypothetical protein n=1 Tax=Microbacterium sp. USHLN272 TaxID=3081287 RepID=UPI00301B2938